MDVFWRYFFAYSTSKQGPKTNFKAISIITIKHAYLPATKISDKRSEFLTHVIKEVADVFGITLQHTKTKPIQTIGRLKQSRASIEQALKLKTGYRRSLWHKYVSIAVLNYNTSYLASIGSEPSGVFQGRIPYNFLFLKNDIRSEKTPMPN